MPDGNMTSLVDHKILDIRQDIDYLRLPEQIINGLSSKPPFLPSFLLWNDKGLELFDRFSQTSSYYLFHSEIEILNRYASEISANVPHGGALIELGCGAIRKTKTIMSVFKLQQKPIHYYALDVSLQSLTNSINELTETMHGSELLTISGLLGTYEDCISWLSKPENLDSLSSVTFLWMGNSIANFYQRSEASAFLARFKSACQFSHIDCNFILSTDICHEEAKIHQAYNLNSPEFVEYLLNALSQANAALGQDVFRLEDWKCESQFDRQERNLHVYYAARSDVQVTPAKGLSITFDKGTRVRIETSGKWNADLMGETCETAGFRIRQQWKDASGVYCIYFVTSNGR